MAGRRSIATASNRCVLELSGYAALRSHSNSSMLTHPTRGQVTSGSLLLQVRNLAPRHPPDNLPMQPSNWAKPLLASIGCSSSGSGGSGGSDGGSSSSSSSSGRGVSGSGGSSSSSRRQRQRHGLQVSFDLPARVQVHGGAPEVATAFLGPAGALASPSSSKEGVEQVGPFEPDGSAAFLSHSNISMLTHPAREQAAVLRHALGRFLAACAGP